MLDHKDFGWIGKMISHLNTISLSGISVLHHIQHIQHRLVHRAKYFNINIVIWDYQCQRGKCGAERKKRGEEKRREEEKDAPLHGFLTELHGIVRFVLTHCSNCSFKFIRNSVISNHVIINFTYLLAATVFRVWLKGATDTSTHRYIWYENISVAPVPQYNETPTSEMFWNAIFKWKLGSFCFSVAIESNSIPTLLFGIFGFSLDVVCFEISTLLIRWSYVIGRRKKCVGCSTIVHYLQSLLFQSILN